MKAQGATEYLVLLAVVLIVALVSVALLGFFPGMAGDSQITQSQTYWLSASPIAITEGVAKAWASCPTCGTYAYIRIRNAGTYPIRVTKMLGANQSVSQFFNDSDLNLSDYYYMAPGEEKYFGYVSAYSSLPATRQVDLKPIGGGTSSAHYLYATSSGCSTTPPYGTLQINNFGFEYIVYIEGQQVTKRQVGKPLVIKCGDPF